jgi:hypothetical protein
MATGGEQSHHGVQAHSVGGRQSLDQSGHSGGVRVPQKGG